ncbi:MAG: SHOCT domain-containing protein [Anaerolinea sp.]|nr:SHOCT domain-containing protein [Anaerolinea sp.]
MPGLVRGMARTAAVVGTATATRNAVNRRQAEKNMAAYQNAAVATAPPPQQQQVVYAAPPPQPEYIPAQAPAVQEDVITQLERLGALKAQGLLTEEEFNAQKAKLLGL